MIQVKNAVREFVTSYDFSHIDLADPDSSKLSSILVTPPGKYENGCTFAESVWIWPSVNEADRKRPSHRTLSFARLSEYFQLQNAAKRYILAMMLRPLTRYLDLPSLRKRTDYVVKVLLALGSTQGDCSLASTSRLVLQQAFETACGHLSDTLKYTVIGYFGEMARLGAKRTLHDFTRVQIFANEPEPTPVHFELPSDARFDSLNLNEKCQGTLEGVEESLCLSPREPTDQEDAYGKYRPLPDGYVESAGRRWVFYVVDIYPNLITLFKQKDVICLEASKRRRSWGGNDGDLSDGTEAVRQSELWRELLANFIFHDRDGCPIEQLPFATSFDFPPRNHSALLDLFSKTQSSLIQLLLLVTGGRAKEIERLLRTCLTAKFDQHSEMSSPSTISGKTFKLSGLRTGDHTGWPVPLLVATAVQKQSAIAGILSPNGESLWVSTNRSSMYGGVINAYYHCIAFAENHFLSELLDGDNPHPHRYRKTIARIAVLTLTGAPLILSDLFNHKDAEGVIKYILTDPSIRAEMAEFADESQAQLSTEVVATLDEAGGPGATRLRALKRSLEQSLVMPSNELQQKRTVDELLDAQLASGGAVCNLIYPGIVCIKPTGGNGACGKGRKDSQIDSGKCEAICPYFFAFPKSKPTIINNIEFCLAKLADSKVASNPLLRIWYRGQVIDQISIFDDIKLRYSSDPRIALAVPQRGSIEHS